MKLSTRLGAEVGAIVIVWFDPVLAELPAGPPETWGLDPQACAK